MAEKITYGRSRIISGKALDEDARIDASVQAKHMEDFIGQSRVKENLKIAVDGPKSRRGAGPRFVVWAAGFGENDPGADSCQ